MGFGDAAPLGTVSEPVLFQPMCWVMRIITLMVQMRKRRLREVQKEVALGHTTRKREVQSLLCAQVHLCFPVRQWLQEWGEERRGGGSGRQSFEEGVRAEVS